MPKIEILNAATTTIITTEENRNQESGTEIDAIEIIPSKHDNRNANMKVFEDRNEIEDDDDDDEIMFWREQR